MKVNHGKNTFFMFFWRLPIFLAAFTPIVSIMGHDSWPMIHLGGEGMIYYDVLVYYQISHIVRTIFVWITDSVTILFHVSIMYESDSMPVSSRCVAGYIPSLWLWIPSKHFICVPQSISSASDIEDAIQSDAFEIIPVKKKKKINGQLHIRAIICQVKFIEQKSKRIELTLTNSVSRALSYRKLLQ